MSRFIFILLALLASTSAFAQPAGDAKSCVDVRLRTAKGETPHYRITNKCAQTIGINYCHEPSAQPGTRGTQCGEKDRYYQQFTTLEPGADTGNLYSTPADAHVRYGACFGGQGKIKQTTGGDYNCR